MASKKLGMNVNEMETLRKLVHTELEAVKTLRKQLETEVGAVDWQGRDADRFKKNDWPAARGDLDKVITILNSTEGKLRKNISQQQHASR